MNAPAVFHSKLISVAEANRLYPKADAPLVAMVPGEPQRQARAERGKKLREVAVALRASGMRVPVFISELAVGVQLALYGQDNGLARAMVLHNRRLALAGVKGVFEQ